MFKGIQTIVNPHRCAQCGAAGAALIEGAMPMCAQCSDDVARLQAKQRRRKRKAGR